MWSLPDINKLNAEAAANAAKLKRDEIPEDQKCECYGCESDAVRKELVFDIFSDDPKEAVYTCEEHDMAHDSGDNYFRCGCCNRLMVDHYTWERYCVLLNDCELVCLNCFAEHYFADDENWIDPSEVKSVAERGSEEPVFCRATGVFNPFACKHVLGVKQPEPKGIKFVDNCEFDSHSGAQISGDDVLDIIRNIKQPFCAVVDAAYQFAVSIGFYVKE